jgi:TolB-like protein
MRSQPSHDDGFTGSQPYWTDDQGRVALPLPDRLALAAPSFVNMTVDAHGEYFTDGIDANF